MKQLDLVSSKKILTHLFFISVFFVGVRIGYEEIMRLPTAYILYFIFLVFISINISRVKYKIIDIKLLIASTCITLISFSLQTILGLFKNESINWFFLYMSFFIIFFYVSNIISTHELIKMFSMYSYISYVFVFISFALGMNGIILGADIWNNGQTIRPHGLYSEPSNLCWTLPYMLIIAYHYKKNWLIKAILVTLILLVQSPTVLGVFLILIVMYGIIVGGILTRTLILSLLIFFVLFLIMMLNSKINYMEVGNTTIDRLIAGIYAIGNTDLYSNARWSLFNTWIDFIKANPWVLILGIGLGASNSYTESFSDGMTLDSSLLAFLINSYGLILFVFLALSLLYILIKLKSFEFRFFILSLAIAGLFNPSGIFWQGFFIFVLIVGFKSLRKRQHYLNSANSSPKRLPLTTIKL